MPICRSRDLDACHGFVERDNVNVHRAAANIIVSKSRAARGSVCNVLLSSHRLSGDQLSDQLTLALPLMAVSARSSMNELRRDSKPVESDFAL